MIINRGDSIENRDSYKIYVTLMFTLPVYQVPRYDLCSCSWSCSCSCSSSLKVIDIGAENMGLFISKGYDEEGGLGGQGGQGGRDPRLCFHFSPNEFTYIDSLRGLKLETFPCVGHMSLYDLIDHLDLKLERFAFNGDVIRRLRAAVEKRIKEQEIQAFKTRTSVKKVQRRWREIISDPSFKVCKKRLMREFEEM